LKPLESKPGAIEVAYHFLVAAQGQGYAAEAARAITRYGFETLGLDEIVATVLPTNAPSQKTIIRAGFTRSGTLMHGGRLHDFFVARREAWLAAQR
jgi:ribosomal-protein-alanine N-acetyltransferase